MPKTAKQAVKKIAEKPESKKVKVRVLTWDWKEQPDFGEIGEAIKAVFDGKNCPIISCVDTESDQFAIVISPVPITSKEARKAYRKWEDNGEEVVNI